MSHSPDYTGTIAPAVTPAARKRPWGVSEIIAWAVILILATITAIAAAWQQSEPNSSPAKAEMLTFISQYALGVNELGKGGTALFAGNAQATARVMQELDDTAKTPEDRLRVAILAGELQGADEAIKRIKTLADIPEVQDDAATAAQLYENQTLPEPQLAAFRAKYDWFADLAVSFGKPPGDPDRARALKAAYRTLAIMLSVLVAMIGATAIGLVVLIIGIILLLMRKIKLAYRTTLRFQNGLDIVETTADRRAYLQGFACYLAGLLGFGLVLHIVIGLTFRNESILTMMAVQLGAVGMAFGLGILWPQLMGQNAAQWRAALGLHNGRGFFREVGSGMLGYLAGLPILALGIFLTSILSKFSGTTPNHPINDILNKGTAWLAAAFILASICAPITEEIMFRGALFSHLRERFGWWIAAPIVAFIFAIIHPQSWIALPALGSIAIVLAGIREWRGSIIGCITAHALHNSITLAVALIFLKSA